MKRLCISIAALAIIALFSCSKNVTTRNLPYIPTTTQSIYQKFVDSLDPLTQTQRLLAFDLYAPKTNRITNIISSTSQNSKIETTDDATYWSQLTDVVANSGQSKQSVTLDQDLGNSSDTYMTIDGQLVYLEDPQKS